MKAQKLYTWLLYAAAIFCAAGHLHAQTSISKASLFTKAAKEKNPNEANTAVINAKVKKAFIKEFGTAALHNWSAVNDKFINHFYINGARTNALYNKNGHLIYAVTYGTEDLLPANLKALVQDAYTCDNITQVYEILQQGRHVWIVQLQNNNKIITARIEDGELEEMQQFNKSK